MADTYKIYSTLNLGVVKFDPGFKTFEEIYVLVDNIRTDKKFSKIRYQVVDLRGCKFCFKPLAISELLELIHKHNELDNLEQCVYLVNSPKETAYLIIFCLQLNNRTTCSTIERAYEFLKLSISFKQFEKLVDI